MISKRVRKAYKAMSEPFFKERPISKKQEGEQKIAGVAISELAEMNQKLSRDFGWLPNAGKIMFIIDPKAVWKENWVDFTKKVYLWQIEVVKRFYDIKENYFDKEWGLVGRKTLPILEAIYKEEIEEAREKSEISSDIPSVGTGVSVMPKVILKNPISGMLLFDAVVALKKILPKGSKIISGYRSSDTQKMAIDKYFGMAVKHPDFEKYRGRYMSDTMKKRIAEEYMQNVEGRAGWKIALPGKSNHQKGIALDISGPPLPKIIEALQQLKKNPVDGITIETSMGDRQGILPEGSHVHALFRYI